MSISRWNLITDLIITNQYKKIAEIGVSNGDTAFGVKTLLEDKQYEIQKYYAIDPFNDTYYAMSNKRQIIFSFWNSYIPLRYTSNDALQYIEELDLVFIDGSHNEEQMCIDIINYAEKLNHGGCIVGHDFLNPLMPKVTSYIETIMGKEINIIQDKRDENGKPNYLWWTYKVEEGVYAKINKRIPWNNERINET